MRAKECTRQISCTLLRHRSTAGAGLEKRRRELCLKPPQRAKGSSRGQHCEMPGALPTTETSHFPVPRSSARVRTRPGTAPFDSLAVSGALPAS